VSDETPRLSPLPPVELVRPGLWSIPVPLPDNALRYVLVYLFETDRGPYLVDAGWDTDDAWDTLAAGVERAGCSLGEVQGVLVTHIHPDHYGLAGRVREASGAWIALHPADAALIGDRYEDPAPLLERLAGLLRRNGAPAEELGELTAASMPVRPFVWAVEPDVLVEDGDRLDVDGWDLEVLWTPGHSPGHVCLRESRYRLLLSGDHVLPRVTPNVSYHPQAGPNPLGAYLASLDKLAGARTDEVLPAHEHRFVGLEARLAELRAHHEARLCEALAVLEGGAATAWTVAAALTWSRPWEQITGFMRRAAVGEALAHLHALRFRGMVDERVGEPSLWVLTPRGETVGAGRGG